MKEVFMSKVLGNLILQSFLAYNSAKYVMDNQEVEDSVLRNQLFIAISSLAILLVLIFARLGTPIKFVLFTIFSTLIGALLSSVKTMDREKVKEALAATVGIFVVMFVAGLLSTRLKIDFVPIALALFVIYLVTLFATLLRYNTSKIFVPIFALFVLVETNIMMRKNYQGDFVNGSLSYFTDIVNLFTNLLQSINND